MRGLARLLVFATLGLAGCSETTVFASLPAGASTECDPSWPGTWQVTLAGDAASDTESMRIGSDCRSSISKGKLDALHLTLVEVGSSRYLQVHRENDAPECVGEGESHCGIALFRYEQEGDIVRLYDSAHAEISTAIRTRTVPGYTISPETTMECPAAHKPADTDATGCAVADAHHNFVAGDPTRIAAILRGHPEFFQREPIAVLRKLAPRSDAATTRMEQ